MGRLDDAFTVDADDFVKALSSVSEKFKGNARANIQMMGNVFLETARAKVPVDTGALRDSITLEIGENPLGPYAELTVEDPVWYVEYGTENRPPTPFVRPARRKATRELGKGFTGK